MPQQRGGQAHLVPRHARRRARHDKEERLAHRRVRRVHDLVRREAYLDLRLLRARFLGLRGGLSGVSGRCGSEGRGREGGRLGEEGLADLLADEAHDARRIAHDLGEQNRDAGVHVSERQLSLLEDLSKSKSDWASSDGLSRRSVKPARWMARQKWFVLCAKWNPTSADFFPGLYTANMTTKNPGVSASLTGRAIAWVGLTIQVFLQEVVQRIQMCVRFSSAL